MNINSLMLHEYHINEYLYQIVNVNKKHFDGANTMSNPEKIIKSTNIIDVFENNDSFGKLLLTQTTQNEDLVINFLDVKYCFLLNDKTFICEFNDIILKVNRNDAPNIKKYADKCIGYLNNNTTHETDEIININKCALDKIKLCDNSIGLLLFLLFGFKRYGDWIQAKICKKHYISIQTSDALLQT